MEDNNKKLKIPKKRVQALRGSPPDNLKLLKTAIFNCENPKKSKTKPLPSTLELKQPPKVPRFILPLSLVSTEDGTMREFCPRQLRIVRIKKVKHCKPVHHKICPLRVDAVVGRLKSLKLRVRATYKNPPFFFTLFHIKSRTKVQRFFFKGNTTPKEEDELLQEKLQLLYQVIYNHTLADAEVRRDFISLGILEKPPSEQVTDIDYKEALEDYDFSHLEEKRQELLHRLLRTGGAIFTGDVYDRKINDLYFNEPHPNFVLNSEEKSSKYLIELMGKEIFQENRGDELKVRCHFVYEGYILLYQALIQYKVNLLYDIP